LTELRLGSSAEKAEGNSNTFTVDGFKQVLWALKAMQKLTTLDMQILHVDELDIMEKGTRSLLDIGIGQRGALFVS
jgi:hypothetical protein